MISNFHREFQPIPKYIDLTTIIAARMNDNIFKHTYKINFIYCQLSVAIICVRHLH